MVLALTDCKTPWLSYVDFNWYN